MGGSESNPWEDFLAGLDPELRALNEAPPPEDDMPIGDRTVPRAELLAVLGEQVSAALEAGPRAIRPDREAAGMVAAAWRLIVFGNAHAVLTLLHAGLEVEPQANARVCFEHAVALQELALAADADNLDAAVEQLVGDAWRYERRQLDHLYMIDAETGGTNRTLIDAARKRHESGEPKPDYKGRQIRDMFERVSSGGALYDVYRRLSQATHAGLGSTEPYVHNALRTRSAKVAAPEKIPWAETAAFLCWSCCAAEDAMRRFVLQDGSDLAARQVDLLVSIGLISG